MQELENELTNLKLRVDFDGFQGIAFRYTLHTHTGHSLWHLFVRLRKCQKYPKLISNVVLLCRTKCKIAGGVPSSVSFLFRWTYIESFSSNTVEDPQMAIHNKGSAQCCIMPRKARCRMCRSLEHHMYNITTTDTRI